MIMHMEKISAFWKRKYTWWGLGALAVLLIGFFVFGNGNGQETTIVAERSDFINQVAVSGKVETASEADLGFASAGRIGKIFTKEGDVIKENQILAQLEIGDLLADLKIKEANSRQENTEVESAYRQLLSEDLELIPYTDNYTVGAPEVSGIYDGAEGRYKIIIEKEKNTLTDLTLRTFGLEDTKQEINEQGSTPLGTRGLYITFPDKPKNYHETIWYLDIPNKASSSYLVNYNEYNEAKAEFENQQLSTEKNGNVSSVTQAEIDKIRAEIRKSTIYAPFAGVTTNVAKEVGETAATNETVITVQGGGTFQIESFVPEVNIALINVGDEAEITLDAYGEDILFYAKVISIDPAETIRDGVSTYKVKLQFSEEDERIKAGMTANVSIIIFNKPDVIVLPGGVVFEEDGQNFVKVKTDQGVVKRAVMLGEISTLGQVEIVSGLAEGEEVILIPNSK